MTTPNLERELVIARMNQCCDEWRQSIGVELSSDERRWMGRWVVEHHGPGGFTKSNLDEAFAELRRQQKKDEDFKRAHGVEGVKGFDWFTAGCPSIPYFDSGSPHNWGRYQSWWNKQTENGVVLPLADFINHVKDTMWESGAWHWKISDQELMQLILKAGQGGDSNLDPSLIQYGRVNGHLMPVGGKLCDRFGIANIQRAYGLLWDRSHSNRSHTQDAASVSVAESVHKAVHENPMFVDQKHREADNVVSIYRGRNHAETARHREILSQTFVKKEDGSVDWFATLETREKRASELYNRTL
jgi:hypothetical protein